MGMRVQPREEIDVEIAALREAMQMDEFAGGYVLWVREENFATLCADMGLDHVPRHRTVRGWVKIEVLT